MKQRYLGSRSHPSLLPHFLVALYGLAIVYASLQPFAPWIAPAPGTPFFLFAPWPPRWTRFDVDRQRRRLRAVRLLRRADAAPAPAARPARRSRSRAGAALSFALETLQMFLPPRDASAIDLIANTAGAALGGARRDRVRALGRPRSAASCRSASAGSCRARSATSGLALLAIWLAVAGESGHPAVRDRVRSGGGVRRRRRDPRFRRRPTSSPRSSRARTARSSCSASGSSCRCCCASAATSAARCCC